MSQGETMLRKRLAEGVTLTVDLQHGDQVDLLVGQLPNGQAPRRPFTDGVPWRVNERLDGARPRLPASALFLRGQWLSGSVAHTPVRAPCPWYLVTATHARRAVAAIRVRKGRLVAGDSRSRVVTITLVSFRIRATKPSGSAWDAFGGAPDPMISVGDRRVRHVVYNRRDTFQDTPTVAAPEPFEITPGNPITITAIDRDILFDDPIGTATLRYRDLARGPELTLPLRLGGATTGYVHVRVEPAR